ncbi:glutaredoxin 2 [Piedraia hortae CBS 480.64]|uniref:Glutaredoxin-like protein n=1 Tax=Piedraia hortae CBS 480.64 TaxID=1314780 RepID=A0A6A7BX97_9PEZI|nr:glutaredoxin 2 [Piedraia hortae CBS 480.64]
MVVQNPLRLTLFTRASCSLCVTAHEVISRVAKRRTFRYEELNVMAPDQRRWRILYQNETPVLHIDPHTVRKTTPAARKLMHRFTEDELEKVMDEVEAANRA